MISLQALNPKGHFLDDTTMKNLVRLCKAMLQIEHSYEKEITVTRGYSTEEEQHRIDPAHPGSAHCVGLAVDCADISGDLWTFCVENLDLVTSLGLYLEDRLYSPKHVHFQLIAPKSKNRIFFP